MPSKTRTVRINKTKQKTTTTGEVAGKRTVPNIIEECGPKLVYLPEVALTLTEVEVSRLVDAGSESSHVQKTEKKQADIIKAILKEYAQKGKKDAISSPKGFASFGNSSKTEVGTATELGKLLKEMDMLNLFDDLVSVKIGEVKKYIDEKILIKKGFITIKTTKRDKVTLKRL